MTASHPVVAWLLEATARRDAAALLTELGERLLVAGVPLFRTSTSLFTLHPEVLLRNLIWIRGEGCRGVPRPHDLRSSAMYLGSPVAAIHAGGPSMHLRLDGEEARRYPSLDELRAAGATDYVILPLRYSDGRISFVSWASDDPTGFTAEHVELLEQLQPLLAMRFEIESAYFATRSLLEVYLGQNAAQRVLAGAVRRGTGEVIGAAILVCDLRGFTRFTDERPVVEVVETLDRYFESVAAPIAAGGGEVLKFIGDALLAIFAGTGDDAAAACGRALAAAEGALAAMAAWNEERRAAGRPPIAIGLALHHGDVMYGNIGACGRLDFTVIGRAVNEVCRVEPLCKELHVPLLTTGTFAARLAQPGRLRSLGAHVLRGVADPQELFAIPDGGRVS